MSEPASISTGIASRYAKAVFDLAVEDNQLSAIEGDLDSLEAAMADSGDFGSLLTSPVYNREEQAKAIAAVAAKMGLSSIMANTLGLMANKRRLFVLPQLAATLRGKIADHKGEATAEVTAAKALTPEQQSKLAASLKSSIGKDVKVKLAVDESLIGGLIVKVGSKMIDTSIRSQLAALQNTMKEVG